MKISRLLIAISLTTSLVGGFRQAQAQQVDQEVAREWIQEMKKAPKGPFEAIQWYCDDGTVRPARAGCRGPGIQHGQLGDRATALRNAGYPIATVYAALTDTDIETIARSPEVLGSMLIERYLMIVDDGWIMRHARFYRGAFQLEDETEGAKRLLARLLSDPFLASHRYLLLREAVRLLYIEGDGVLLNEARTLATQIAQRDSGFVPVRNKLHMLPEPDDIERVRSHITGASKSNAADLELLVSKLERVFHPVDIYSNASNLIAQISTTPYRKDLIEAVNHYGDSARPIDQFWALADLIYFIRKAIPNESITYREALFVLSLQTEQAMLRLWSTLEQSGAFRTRKEKLQLVLPLLQASYGTGLLSERAYQAGAATINEILRSPTQSLGNYFRELRYLTRVPGWAASEMNWEFGPGIKLMSNIEPAVFGLVPERLRSTLFSAYSFQLELILKEAAQRAGMTHNVAGVRSSLEVRALNEGLARGILTNYDPSTPASDMASRIIITTETEADLPPVAGILTLNDGNSLSHVQLLARNLGIPNAIISENVRQQLAGLIGQQVVLAVSPAGKVELAPNSAAWEDLFKKNAPVEGYLDENGDDLDLSEKDILPLKYLDSDDSGHTVGPKAARLGSLKKVFPEYTSNGIVLPFGIYKSILDQTLGGEEGFTGWLRTKYDRLKGLNPGTQEYQSERQIVLETIRNLVASTQFSGRFRDELMKKFQKELGDPSRVGVFVRSDTNVEDLKGFTGAGLNLTEPNVVGFGNILDAIRKVWASPFQDRSFAWRQGRMLHPENIFVSVLLQRTVPNEKSGVIITSDLESGDPNSFTVAVNQGVGGAVNNQEAEVVVINRPTASVRLLSEASATTMKVANPTGGLETLPVSTRERILSPDELAVLIKLVERVNQKYDSLIEDDNDGERVPVDIEFGFVNGKLALFQIRPFKESVAAKQNRYLVGLDKDLRERFNDKISLSEIIGG